MQHATNTLSILKNYRHKDDGTYDIESGKTVEYAFGYQVSFVRPEAFELLSDAGWDIISNYLSKYLNSNLHIGVYHGESEISFRSEREDKAVEIMEKFNQESMLNWALKKQHPETELDWFVFNRLYDEKRVLDYDEIIEAIQ